MMTTVIVPTLNEAATIEGCLMALAAQDVGRDRMQVIVVDGRSRDGTADIARGVLLPDGVSRFGSGSVIVNDATSRPANLNRGLEETVGAVVCRVDARSRIPPHYISTCNRVLRQRPDIRVVGGRQRAVGQGTVVSLGIARALNNRWGTGGARYRRAKAAGPTDTVYLGAFRTDQLEAAGGWDEHLLINEDFDLNRRMGQHGLVWFEPSLEVDYLPRPSLSALAGQYWQFGRWKARYLRRPGARPQPRQVVAALALPAVAAATVASIASRRARPFALGSALLAAAAVEGLGADGPAAPLRGHVVAAASLAVIANTWVAGLWRELLRPAPPVGAFRARAALVARREAAYYRWFGADRVIDRLIRPVDSVLDVGCSDGRGSRVLGRGRASGVDVHLPSLRAARDSGRRNPVVQADIRRLPFRTAAFDVVVSLDVIEHFEKPDALIVIGELERVARRAVVLMTPRGFVAQPPAEDQPWQQHRCGFDAAELGALDYHVEGQGGIAALRGAYGAFRAGPLGQLAALASARLVRRVPNIAFHLIATKEVGHGAGR